MSNKATSPASLLWRVPAFLTGCAGVAGLTVVAMAAEKLGLPPKLNVIENAALRLDRKTKGLL